MGTFDRERNHPIAAPVKWRCEISSSFASCRKAKPPSPFSNISKTALDDRENGDHSDRRDDFVFRLSRNTRAHYAGAFARDRSKSGRSPRARYHGLNRRFLSPRFLRRYRHLLSAAFVFYRRIRSSAPNGEGEENLVPGHRRQLCTFSYRRACSLFLAAAENDPFLFSRHRVA